MNLESGPCFADICLQDTRTRPVVNSCEDTATGLFFFAKGYKFHTKMKKHQQQYSVVLMLLGLVRKKRGSCGVHFGGVVDLNACKHFWLLKK